MGRSDGARKPCLHPLGLLAPTTNGTEEAEGGPGGWAPPSPGWVLPAPQPVSLG